MTIIWQVIAAIGAAALGVLTFAFMRDQKKISEVEAKAKEKEIENVELKTKNIVDNTPLNDLIGEHNKELRDRKQDS